MRAMDVGAVKPPTKERAMQTMTTIGCLPLTFPAKDISWFAIHLDLPHVPSHRFQTFDLSRILVRKPSW
jgi:hypothetical protein